MAAGTRSTSARTGKTANRIDFDRIRREYRLDDVARSYGVELTAENGEYKGCCPLHGEANPSFSIYTAPDNVQRFYCFGCGEKGDVVDFVAKLENLSAGDAARVLTGEVKTDRERVKPRPAPEHATKVETWEPVPLPVPDDAPPPVAWPETEPFTHPRLGRAAMTWSYVNTSGHLVGYVCRFDLPDGGGKEVLPMSYGRQGNRPAGWRFKAFAEPRPLYGLDRLAARPTAQVLIVEGEKTADAAQRLIPALVVVSWPGGSKAIGKVDWTPLVGRKVCIWPDGDSQRYGDNHPNAGQIKPLDEQAGTVAALKIAAAIREATPEGAAAPYLRIVRLPDPREPNAPGDGWDLADAEAEGWDMARVVAYMREHVVEPWTPAVPERPASAATCAAAAPKPANDDAPPYDDAPPEYDPSEAFSDADYCPPPMPADDDAFDWPFQCLGHAGGVYYFLPRNTGRIVDLSPSSMSRAPMLQLAPLSWWSMNFPAKNGVAWLEATDALMTRCHRVGFYNPLRVRGLGAWMDAGRAVVHMGDRLMVDGAETQIHDFDTDYIYEAGVVAEHACAKPATVREAHRLVDLCEALSWERPIYGKLLAGWCAVAHVCGALRWRPHIWVTGPSGCGKTWVYDNLLKPCLDGYALPCQSNTTEAGLRQALGNDAKPVLFDEAESDDAKGQARIRNVLELMRQASSENGAAILKGTANGQAQQFRIRSVFAFCSIVVAADRKADLSRVTVLTLKPDTSPGAAERFKAIQALQSDLMIPAYVARLRARSIRLIPVIRANAETFAVAAASRLGSRRYGDQLGALLAGAYSLHSDREISPEDAAAWVDAQNWEEQRESPDEADEQRLLLAILQLQVPIDGVSGGPSVVRREIGEVCRALVTGKQDASYYPDAGQAALARMGVRVEGGYPDAFLVVSNTHAALKKNLENTPWGTGWSRLLARIKGAQRVEKAVRFAGSVAKAVRIPISSTPIAEEKDDRPDMEPMRK